MDVVFILQYCGFIKMPYNTVFVTFCIARDEKHTFLN